MGVYSDEPLKPIRCWIGEMAKPPGRNIEGLMSGRLIERGDAPTGSPEEISLSPEVDKPIIVDAQK